jgi:hypothetical protein
MVTGRTFGFLLFSCVAATGQAWDCEVYLCECGEPIAFEGYEVAYSGVTYRLPMFVTIERDGATVWADETPKMWVSPYMGLREATVGDHLILEAGETDCIDIDSRRIFIFSPKELVFQGWLWTANHRAGFYLSDERLTYWSEWFCDRLHNREIVDELSYVYQFTEDLKSAGRRSVAWAENCPTPEDVEFLEFLPLPLLAADAN